MSAAPSTPKKKMGTGMKVLIGLVIACPVSVVVVGILAAIAIPAFIGYLGRAKTAEARANLSTIAAGLESYRAEHGSYPSAERTPMVAPCGVKELWSPTDPTWEQIGFSPLEPLYYSYEVEGGADHYVIRARGDLDCDGTTSLFERTSDSPEVRVENELE